MIKDKHYLGLLESIHEYRNRLDSYTEQEFLKKPNAETWSPAEVYAHIISANRMTLKGMQKAIDGNATEDYNSLSWKSRLVLFFEKFPKGRKVPEVVQKRTPVIGSITEAREVIEAMIQELNQIVEQKGNWKKSQKLKHPALGLLNNFQWLKFMKVHTKHHLKQLERIKNL